MRKIYCEFIIVLSQLNNKSFWKSPTKTRGAATTGISTVATYISEMSLSVC